MAIQPSSLGFGLGLGLALIVFQRWLFRWVRTRRVTVGTDAPFTTVKLDVGGFVHVLRIGAEIEPPEFDRLVSAFMESAVRWSEWAQTVGEK